MNVVIVESPAKAKTISKYLGSDYQVFASFGHIRDLPSKDGSVRPNEDFAMTYEIIDRAQKYVKTITQAVKKSNKVFLATDPDREGEAISWHILEALIENKAVKKDVLVKRVVFNEITKNAVITAINNPRDIDLDLVNAQQARRALDYLVGFNLSPILWRKLPGSKSAGRVQSVALRIVCDRENEIEKFVSQEYWDIKLDLATSNKEQLLATLSHFNSKKLDKFAISNDKQANDIVKLLKEKTYKISKIDNKQISRNPQPPFITSSLQQEASRKLGYSAKYTMQLAQKLYEGIEVDGENVGLITYMRTDALYLAQEAITSARNLIKSKFGDAYLPKSAKTYKTKAKNAQEAHEAIRPTNIFEFTPDKIKKSLDKDLFRLYELIWKRTVACQMENAILDVMSIEILSHDGIATARASGSTLKFDGFYKLYREGLDDQEDEEDKLLPQVKVGEELAVKKITPAQHFTEPPPRFSEASLVKKLEELGIGRPSTYANIISVLQEREYVRLEKKRFIPEERGRLVTAFLISFFKNYIEYDFTAHLEDELDRVSEGKLEWKLMLKNFWQDFEINVQETAQQQPSVILEAINELLEHHFFPDSKNNPDCRKCPSCQQGKLSIKLGKFGAFYACSAYPECNYTKPIGDSASNVSENNSESQEHKELVGIDPTSGQPILLKKGPYGFYVQLGEPVTPKDKPKRSTIPSFIDPLKIELEQAILLLSLPREIGIHPETQKHINVGIGKFGPYLLHNGKYTSIKNPEEIFSIGINRAVAMIADTGNGKTNEPLHIVGEHPDGGEIAIFGGRYGPYIKYKKINAPMPKGAVASEISIELAVELIQKAINKKNLK